MTWWIDDTSIMKEMVEALSDFNISFTLLREKIDVKQYECIDEQIYAQYKNWA